ncbi:hypothetical protein LINPERHAP2_LOCUS25394 [Linum perenne]
MRVALMVARWQLIFYRRQLSGRTMPQIRYHNTFSNPKLISVTIFSMHFEHNSKKS